LLDEAEEVERRAVDLRAVDRFAEEDLAEPVFRVLDLFAVALVVDLFAVDFDAVLRFLAADFACLDSACLDAADLPSRLRAFVVARERFAFGADFLVVRPFRLSLAAFFLVASEAFFGAPSSTPARRAFDKPIAMACFEERAPCLPSRMWCISSRTNSPACVVGALPSCLSFLARLKVSFSGISL
jgi:hypothetical protein